MFATHTRLAGTMAAAGLGLAGLVAPVAAHAAPDGGYFGRVTANGGLSVRSLPTTFSDREGTIAQGKTFPITCKVTGTVVRRDTGADEQVDNFWYRLPGSSQWVTALYVDTMGATVPYCGNGKRFTGQVTTAQLTGREAPTTRSNAHGSLPSGTKVTIVCKLAGEDVGGNDLWYNLDDSRWVSARYVANVGAAPVFCTR